MNSLWLGIALIAVGASNCFYSVWGHAHLAEAASGGTAVLVRMSRLAVMLAALLAVIGLAAGVDLILLGWAGASSHAGSHAARPYIAADMGIIDRPSNHSVDDTVARLEGMLRAKGVTLFAVVDHGGGARKAGMTLRPTKLLIFGIPKVGTPVMLAAPSSAIDLPLKLLVHEDDHGRVWISYNSPAYLAQRHGLPAELLPNLSAVESLAAKAAE